MGLFRKSVKKTVSTESSASSHGPDLSLPEQTPTHAPVTSSFPTTPVSDGGRKYLKRGDTFPSVSFSSSDPKLDVIPKVVNDLRNAKDPSGEKPANALRMLFSLTEHASHLENRIEMVTAGDKTLVPVLLEFLQRCEKGSSEQYLTLLVLNNISIPRENKRFIALDCRAVDVLARLLCSDPSCHLIAIILVNLSFSDADLRKELASVDVELVQSLAFVLKVASLTPEEYLAKKPQLANNDGSDWPPSELLASLIGEDQRLSTDATEGENKGSTNSAVNESLMFPYQQQYPETARWCLSALKNLTRPSKDGSACQVLIETGVVPLIFRYVTVGGLESLHDYKASENHGGSQSSSSDTPSPADPTQCEDLVNDPSMWDSHSMQDAALSIVMNLAAMAESRSYVRGSNAIQILSSIVDSKDRTLMASRDYSIEEIKQLEFQCMKARMALAYLVGSEGHFGQLRVKNSNNCSNPEDSVLLLTETEVTLMVELVANTINNRGKDGPGGYSAATFSVKFVLFAIRCLLTNTLNQVRFVNTADVKLNALLMKALALHSVLRVPTIDAEAAEYAAFSLYLQSNYGFQTRFLPSFFGGDAKTGNLAAKVFTSYVHMDDITPAGRHAADQLLLRLRYLNFRGTVAELASPSGDVPTADDFKFDEDLLGATENIIVEKRSHGTKPRSDIFNRPILRGRAPRKGSRAPWDKRAATSIFPSALHAVQDLSFGSTKVRHADAIDDILIANNIANSANGEKTESYHYWWSWQDKAGEIQKNLERQRSGDSTTIFSVSTKVLTPPVSVADEPISIFGLRCGGLCVADTTDGPETK